MAPFGQPVQTAPVFPVTRKATCKARSVASVPVQTTMQTVRFSGSLAASFPRFHHVSMPIAGMRVQRSGLCTERFGYVRMAMANRSDIVIAIQITPPVCIPQPDILAFNQMQWVIAKMDTGRTPCSSAPMRQAFMRFPF